MSYVAIPFEAKDPKDEKYFRVVAFRPDGTPVDAPIPATVQAVGSVPEREGADGEKYPVYSKNRALALLNYIHGGDGKELKLR